MNQVKAKVKLSQKRRLIIVVERCKHFKLILFYFRLKPIQI